MAYVPYIPAEQIARDSAGLAESGAKLWFRLFNTTTPVTVYQDPAGASPHTNPVLSAADGAYPAIYWDNSIRTRVLKTGPAAANPNSPDWQVDDIGVLAGTAGMTVNGSNGSFTAGEATAFRGLIAAGVENTFATRTAAGNATISTDITTIYVERHTAGRPICIAVYKEVTDTGTLLNWQFRSNGATRRWELSYDQRVTLPMFGAVMNGSTNDYSAVNDAEQFFYTQGGGTCYVPTGYVLCNTGIVGRSSVLFEGDGNYYNPTNQTIGGFAFSELGTVFIFADNLTGFEFQPADPATPGSYTAKNSFGGGLRRLSVVSKSGGSGGGAYNGIYARTAIIMDDISVRGFEQDNIHIEANQAAGSPTGNANLFTINRVTSTFAGRDGFFNDGADVNAGVITRLDSRSNGRYGVNDSSVLGNVYVGLHVASNAGNAGDLVQIYTADTAPNTFIGTYVEGGGFVDIGNASVLFGGSGSQLAQAAPTNRGLIMTSSSSHGLPLKQINTVGTNDVGSSLGIFDNSETVFAWSTATESAAYTAWKLKYVSTRWTYQYANSASVQPMTFPLSGTDRANAMWFDAGIFIGPPGSGKLLFNGTVAPASGTWAVGDIVYNRVPASGQPIGWGCSVAGTPGTWVAMANYA